MPECQFLGKLGSADRARARASGPFSDALLVEMVAARRSNHGIRVTTARDQLVQADAALGVLIDTILRGQMCHVYLLDFHVLHSLRVHGVHAQVAQGYSMLDVLSQCGDNLRVLRVESQSQQGVLGTRSATVGAAILVPSAARAWLECHYSVATLNHLADASGEVDEGSLRGSVGGLLDLELLRRPVQPAVLQHEVSLAPALHETSFVLLRAAA